MDEIMNWELSQDTKELGGVVVSHKFKSPINRFLQDLDDMVLESQDSTSLKPETPQNIEPKTEKSEVFDSIEDRKFTQSEEPKRGLKIGNSERESIPFLQVYPSQAKMSENGQLTRLEKEVFDNLLKMKKKELEEKSHNKFKSHDVGVIFP